MKLNNSSITRKRVEETRSRICHPGAPEHDEWLDDYTLKVDIECGDYAIIHRTNIILAVGDDGDLFFSCGDAMDIDTHSAFNTALPNGWAMDPKTWRVTTPAQRTIPFVRNMTVTNGGELVTTDFDITDASLKDMENMLKVWPQRIMYYVSEYMNFLGAQLDFDKTREQKYRYAVLMADPEGDQNLERNLENMLLYEPLPRYACNAHDISVNDVDKRKLKECMAAYLCAILSIPITSTPLGGQNRGTKRV